MSSHPPGIAGCGSGALLRGFLDALPYGAAAYTEPDGALQVASHRFEQAFAGLPYQNLTTLQDTLGITAARASGEVQLPGNGRWYELHRGRIHDQRRQALVLLSAIDISERIEALDSHKHQQEKLLFTSRMMSVGEMAATLAHELNQPLAAIVNYLNGSLRLTEQPAATASASIRRALEAARTQAEHAAAVISRVREFVRAREPRRDAHDIRRIAGTVLELLRLEAERMQLRIDLAFAPGLPDVYADHVMVEQVLLNLVKNGIESMREIPPARRDLRIEGRRNLDGEVEIRVYDRGSGLSPEEQGQVFSPFFTTKSDGLGIGLAICRSIIEYHEGRLFFEPRQGGGSVFGFTLPIAEGRN